MMFFLTQKITIWGTVYRTDTIVALGMADDEMPQFGRISHAIIVGPNVLLTGNLWKAECFDEHIHSYVVHDSNQTFFLKPDKLRNFRPLHVNKHGNKNVVTPRNYIS